MSSERFSQLSAELYLELETAKKNLVQQEQQLIAEIHKQRTQLEEEFESRFAELQKREQLLEMEKQRMTQELVRENDVITINVLLRRDSRWWSWSIFIRWISTTSTYNYKMIKRHNMVRLPS